MKKALFITATALALVGCQPQQGTSPSDSGTSSGQGSSSLTNQTPPSSGSSTNSTNSSSATQTPGQTK